MTEARKLAAFAVVALVLLTGCDGSGRYAYTTGGAILDTKTGAEYHPVKCPNQRETIPQCWKLLVRPVGEDGTEVADD